MEIEVEAKQQQNEWLSFKYNLYSKERNWKGFGNPYKHNSKEMPLIKQ